MALDPTAREANVRDSLKKFFVDSLGSSYEIMFDKGLSEPNIKGSPSQVDRWISINFGSMERGTLSAHSIMVFMCSRKDNEGFKLAQLCDTVMGYLSDTDQTDGMKRIPLYRSYENQAWTLIGALVVQEVIESPQFESEDGTKYKLFTIQLKWASKI